MSQLIIDRSSDLLQLQKEGYALEVIGGYALVHDVPYVNEQGNVLLGTLVSNLSLAGDATVKPEPHTMQFIGEYPCDKSGARLVNIFCSSGNQDLGDGILINHTFSVKPKDGYRDYYEKFTRYVTLVSGPAQALNPAYTARTYRRNFDSQVANTIFRYEDTNSNKAGIHALAERFYSMRIGIVGLGGTGSYVLDLVSKTPVAEIHLFDGDLFLQHNAFRCPGAPSREELRSQSKKVSYLAQIYGRMHGGLVEHDGFIDHENAEQLKNLDFLFLCIDDACAKKSILSVLKEAGIPFVDVGIGLYQSIKSNGGDGSNGRLSGNIRTTIGTPKTYDALGNYISLGEKSVEDLYATNIQIAELNAMNACLAVLHWKKWCGYYEAVDLPVNVNYCIGTGSLTRKYTDGPEKWVDDQGSCGHEEQ